jgi:putative MATE family efflux protein
LTKIAVAFNIVHSPVSHTINKMEVPKTITSKEAAKVRDWTKGSTFLNLLSLAWPIILAFSFYNIGSTVEMLCVGRLGAAAIAGVAVAGMVTGMVFGLFIGVNTGVKALISRSIGAGDLPGASHIASQGLIIGTVYGIVFAVLGVIFARQVLVLLGLGPDVVAQGTLYLQIDALISVPSCMWALEEGIMQASGDVKSPLKMCTASKTLHIILAPSLILGWWIFPRLGIRGAAIAIVMAECIGMGSGLWFLFTGRTRLKLSPNGIKIDYKTMWRIIRIGIPASLMSFQAQLGGIMLTRLVVPFGTVAVAAYSLGLKIEQVMFMPIWGLGAATGVLTGQNLGAGQPSRAEKTGWIALGIVEAFMFICSIVLLLFANNVVRLFNSDPEVVNMAATLLRIAVAGYLVYGFTSVFGNCLNGAGDTIPPMLVNLFMIWFIQVPLAYFLPRMTSLGPNGVRWGIASGLSAGGIAGLVYFRTGRWKKKKV